EYAAVAPGAVTRYRSSGSPDPTAPSPPLGLVVAPRARVRRARLPASARLTAAEEARLRALRTPAGIQRWLDAVPYHHARTVWSPRRGPRRAAAPRPGAAPLAPPPPLAPRPPP